jgi:hypothetical protein
MGWARGTCGDSAWRFLWLRRHGLAQRLLKTTNSSKPSTTFFPGTLREGLLNCCPQSLTKVTASYRWRHLAISWVYYMKEIKPNSVVIDEHNRKISFEGDNTIVEHTFEGLPKVEKDNKNSITLRGDIERTKNALKLIFTKYCLPTSG